LEVKLMRLSAALLTASLIAAPAVAQGTAFYIPDNIASTGTCNVIPFGQTASSTTWANQRYQTFVTAVDLGNTPGTITGLGFAPCGTGIHNSQSIKITLAHVPSGFSFASTDFDNNLNVIGSGATVVLDQTNYSWLKTQDAWSSVGFDGTFGYDGVSDLLVDIIVVGNDATNGSSSMHRDTRPRLYAYGWSGSPPATGTVSNSALKMQVQMQCADMSIYGAGCGNLSLAMGGLASLGNTMTIDASGGGSGFPIALNIGTFNSSPFPIDLTPFGFRGCSLLSSAESTIGGVTDGSGNATNALTIPNNANLTGVRLFFQYVHINPGAPTGVATSNGGRAVLGPDC
jgi:hypothetical protein